MSNDLVSIIMLSKDNGKYVQETVRSVIAQTYQNWELIFMDDSSKDDTISQMMDLMNEARVKQKDGSYVSRIKVSQNVESKGSSLSMNSALRDARGKWIAFLNVGDLWEPTKLEHQIAFMEKNDYAFTYTKYRFIDSDGNDRGLVANGLKQINHDEMMRCCWPGYLTVMYDADKIGKQHIRNLQKENDYALWLQVSEKADCYLLEETLATLRTSHKRLSPFPLRGRISWRYQVYRLVEDLGPMVSSYWTIVNLFNGLMKKIKYVHKG